VQGLASPRGSYSPGLSQDHRQDPLAAGRRGRNYVAQGRQAGDPALEAAVLRGPANGDRAIGGLRTAVPYPHHAAS